MTKKDSSARRATAKEPAEEPAPVATPVAFARQWVAENPEAFRKLLVPPAECSVCFEAFGPERPPLSPITGDWPTKRRHFLCKACWYETLEKNQNKTLKCPSCRENVTDWLHGLAEEDPGSLIAVSDGLFKEYLGRSIKMAIQFYDLEMAELGAEIYKSFWSIEELDHVHYEMPPVSARWWNPTRAVDDHPDLFSAA